jgi:hypothetical protein
MNVVAFQPDPRLIAFFGGFSIAAAAARARTRSAQSEGRLLTAGVTLRRDVRGDRGGGVVRTGGE